MPRIKNSALRKEITNRFLKELARKAVEMDTTMDTIGEMIGVAQSNISRMKDPESNSGVTIEMLHDAWKNLGISPNLIITGHEETPDKVLAQINKRLGSIENKINSR